MASLALLGLTQLAIPASAKNITGQTAIGRPGIATTSDGTIYVGFTGADGSVNGSGDIYQGGKVYMATVCPNLYGGELVLCTNTTSDTAQWGTGPALATAVLNSWPGQQIITAFAATDSAGHIVVGHYDGTSIQCHTRLSETTKHSPYLVGAGGSTVFLAWTGTDGHVNIAKLDVSACADDAGQVREVSKTTLTDTSVAGPGITIMGGNVYVAWAGTDSAHHIYTGEFTGSSSLGHHTCLCSYATDTDIGLDNNNGTVRMAYTGTDFRVYIAVSHDGYTYPTQTTDGSNTARFGPDITNSGPDVIDSFTGTDGNGEGTVNVDTCLVGC